jgi:TonB family protein
MRSRRTRRGPARSMLVPVPVLPTPIPPTPSPRPGAARALGQRAGAPRAAWGGGGSLGASALAHGALLVGLLLASGVESGGSTSAPPAATLRLSDAAEDLDLPPTPVEPRPVAEEVPEPPAELVEAPDAPEPPVEEASLAELPLRDPLAAVASLRRPPAPEPEPEPEPEPTPEVAATPPLSGVAGPPPSAPVEPAPDGPEELEGDALPEVVEGPLPVYPDRALRFRRQGTVRLRGVVAADGAVLAVEVVESSGHEELDRAAELAFRRWRFVPRSDDDPERRIVLKPFTFRLP